MRCFYERGFYELFYSPVSSRNERSVNKFEVSVDHIDQKHGFKHELTGNSRKSKSENKESNPHLN